MREFRTPGVWPCPKSESIEDSAWPMPPGDKNSISVSCRETDTQIYFPDSTGWGLGWGEGCLPAESSGFLWNRRPAGVQLR